MVINPQPKNVDMPLIRINMPPKITPTFNESDTMLLDRDEYFRPL